MQPSDIKRNYADIDRLETAVGYKSAASIEKGLCGAGSTERRSGVSGG